MTAIEQLITENLDVWASAVKFKSTSGRGAGNKLDLYGINKLRELILGFAVRGLLVPQDSNDEPANKLLYRVNKYLCKEINKATLPKLNRDMSVLSPKDFHYSLPNGWEWVELQDIFLFMNGKAHEQYVTEDERQKFILVNSKFVSNSGLIKKYVTHRLSPLEKGDIAIVMSDVPNGRALARCYLIEKNNIYTLNQRIGGLKTSPELDRNYLAISLNRHDYMLGYDDGKKQTNLKKIQVMSTPLPIPPLEEQHRIVAKVDELMALCDQLEHQTEANISAHQTLVQTLLGALTNASQRNGLTAKNDTPNTKVSRKAGPEATGAKAKNTETIFGTNEAWTMIAEHFETLFTTEWSIDQLKQTILELAVMGKLVPQNPNDEPASELLKKIASKKAKLIKEGKIKKQKPLPTIDEAEKPFDLPEGWEWCRLEELTEIITKGSSPKWQGVSYTDNPEDVLFVTSENVGAFELKLDVEKYVELKFNEVEPRSILRKGDILMNIVGASIGRTAVFNVNRLANINQAVCLIRVLFRHVSLDFLLKFFNSNICISYMFDKQVENARANLSMGNIAKFIIPVPPLDEQHRIVEQVDNLIEICDTLIDRINISNTTQLQLADAMAEKALE